MAKKARRQRVESLSSQVSRLGASGPNSRSEQVDQAEATAAGNDRDGSSAIFKPIGLDRTSHRCEKLLNVVQYESLQSASKRCESSGQGGQAGEVGPLDEHRKRGGGHVRIQVRQRINEGGVGGTVLFTL